MNKTRTLLLLFLLLGVLQLAAPVSMVWHWEDVLKNGERYYWLVEPVDPYEMMKGRYIDLYFKDRQAPVIGNDRLLSGQSAFGLIDIDQDGYASVSGVTAVRPEGRPYVKIKIAGLSANTVYFSLPFKRYYIPENTALPIEEAYRKHAGDYKVAVRIKDGYGVIEDIFLGAQPMKEVIK